MDKDYYSKYYYYERNHWWFRVRAKIIKDKIKDIYKGNKNIKILNIGAATGFSTEVLSGFGEVTSVEYDKECCDFLKNIMNIPVINASVTDLPFGDKSFDLVCAFDIIEHVDDDSLAVSEMIRVCQTNGFVFITVPAYMGLWSSHDEINHHKRRYLKKQLKKLFPKDGKGVYSTYFNSLLFLPVYIIRKLSNLFKNNRSVNEGTDFDKFTGSFISNVLFGVFSIERFLLKFMKLPFGISIMLVYKK
jgi:ubiquinone/menaquinone biosynthesis C-methylase UbiE